MNTMKMLVRREFWENRSLYIAPLVIAGFIVFSSVFTVIAIPGDSNHASIASVPSVEQIPHMEDDARRELQEAIALPEDHRATAYAVTILVFAAMLSGMVCIVVFFYLIDCLYAERRDRSILFWKSLPVSDSQVVQSKIIVALVIVPLGVLVLSAVTQLLVSFVFWIRFHDTVVGQLMPAFHMGGWLRAQWVALQVAIGGVLWYAPIAGYLLFMSAWARRLVFLWAVLPPVALGLFELATTHTTHVFQFIGQRFVGFILTMDIDASTFKHQAGDVQMPSVHEAFNALSLKGMFTHHEMWIGLAVGAALSYAAIRLRRYRDES
jgi:ABC-2 type transport system permease protein